MLNLDILTQISIDTLNVFICPWVVARNIFVSDLLQRTLSNDLAEWNPVPSSVLLNSHAEIKL